ncbi:gluconate 2-dehydrogenase subunit 3 family protein [Kiloniella litopenaei]|uniref:gluconate 2-dehydrogenase subunit 3 family protein n=1 Tax=Kiloniella litopenaei TaxID=1549748 RepID=UPI003BAD89B6
MKQRKVFYNFNDHFLLSDNVNQVTPIVSRRSFLTVGVAFLLSFGSVFSRVSNAQEIETNRAVFSAFLDTLLPATDSPSASELGVDLDILELSKSIKNYPQLISWGIQWLDYNARERYGAPFPDLSESQKINIVQIAEKSPADYNAHNFFKQVLADAMNAYYSKPITWKNLGFDGPPQPDGFLDFSASP